MDRTHTHHTHTWTAHNMHIHNIFTTYLQHIYNTPITIDNTSTTHPHTLSHSHTSPQGIIFVIEHSTIKQTLNTVIYELRHIHTHIIRTHIHTHTQILIPISLQTREEAAVSNDQWSELSLLLHTLAFVHWRHGDWRVCGVWFIFMNYFINDFMIYFINYLISDFL